MTDPAVSLLITRLVQHYQAVLSLYEAGRVSGDYLQSARDAIDAAGLVVERDLGEIVAEYVVRVELMRELAQTLKDYELVRLKTWEENRAKLLPEIEQYEAELLEMWDNRRREALEAVKDKAPDVDPIPF